MNLSHVLDKVRPTDRRWALALVGGLLVATAAYLPVKIASATLNENVFEGQTFVGLPALIAGTVIATCALGAAMGLVDRPRAALAAAAVALVTTVMTVVLALGAAWFPGDPVTSLAPVVEGESPGLGLIASALGAALTLIWAIPELRRRPSAAR